jgi:pimeloyl-ACP methyl ester carboxylesterase
MDIVAKKIFIGCFLFITLVFSNGLKAQKNWGTYSTTINEQGYAGLRFRYRAFIRSEIEDSDATASIWVQINKNNGHGFAGNLNNLPIKNREWKEYLLEGVIDEDYSQIVLGVLGRYDGRFYFDDVSFEVEQKDKTWKTIYQNSFEKKSDTWIKGSGNGTGANPFFNGQISSDKPNKGKNCFLLTADGVPNFGNNAKHGNIANVNGIKLYYEIYGEGHPLVILHGNGGSIRDASPQLPELIKKYKVIAVDSRAQGKSTDTDAPLNYDIMADDISALLDELKIDSAFVWGQSDGAILGLLMAMDHPKKVSKLLAFGANIQPDSLAVFNWGLAVFKKAINESSNPKKKKLMQLMLDYPNIPYASLSKISIPVLVMAGDRDIIRPEHTLKIFQSIPKSQMCIIPGSTHAASIEQKDLFLELLYNFFDKPFSMPNTRDWVQ